TIQRRYILPNCNLTLEGLSTAVEPTFEEVMSVVMNAECSFPSAKTTLKGGREFLDGLVKAANSYGQGFLSGLPPRQRAGDGPSSVQLKPGEDAFHHLVVQPHVLLDASGNPVVSEQATDSAAKPPVDVKLTTVQLFDLLEAVDQLMADALTLPDVSFSLKPLPRRSVQPSEPVAQRIFPAAVGVSTLAAAAIAVAFLPIPEVEPEPASEREASSPEELGSDGATPGSTDGPTVSPTDAPAATVDAVTAAAVLDERSETAPEITDGAILAQLRQQLSQTLQAEWAGDPSFDDDLVFRVGVSETGDIVGYRYENDAALLNVDETPLPRLTFIPVDPESVAQEPLATFLVTFGADSTVSVESGNSESGNSESGNTSVSQREDAATESSPPGTGTDSAAGLEATIADELTDGDRIRALNDQLYNIVRAEFERVTYPEDISYQVRLTDQGNIIGYEPTNATASAQAAQTPLPTLVEPEADRDRPQVDFNVTFTEDGVVQVSPWKGWPD
ncbi:MAG: DUF4335 domain-containing protein, partial [Cyanobacteria bacterium P01_H01_bin.119]